MSQSEFEKARDEAADDGKWMGGSHGRAVHGAWISGANWAERYMLEQDARVKKLIDTLKGVKHYFETFEEDYEKSGTYLCLVKALQAFEREREGKK